MPTYVVKALAASVSIAGARGCKHASGFPGGIVPTVACREVAR